MADFNVFKDWLLQLVRNPATAAAIAVALSGLVSSMIFLWSFGIPIHLYLGAFDLPGLAVRSAPSVLASFVVGSLLAASCSAVIRYGLALNQFIGRLRRSEQSREKTKLEEHIDACRNPFALLRNVVRSWPLLVTVALATTAIGSYLSHTAAITVLARLDPNREVGHADADDPPGTALSRLVAGIFDRLYVDRHLRPVALSLASTDKPVEGLVLLGANATYTFFYDERAQHPMIVPNEQIEVIAQSDTLPGALRRQDPGPGTGAPERAAAALSAIHHDLQALVATAAAKEPLQVVAMLPDVGHSPNIPVECVGGLLDGAVFRFALGSAGLYDDVALSDRQVTVAAHNRTALAEVAAHRDADPVQERDYLLLLGQTDLSGDIEYNARLAERRALSVARALRAIGMDEQALRPVGLGEVGAAWKEDPGHERSRRVLVYRCRPDGLEAAAPERELAAATAGTPG